MSVPAHAPFDYIALRDLQQAGKIHGDQADPPHQGRRVRRSPRPVRGREGRHPNQMDSRMDTLTQEIYSAEFSKGKLFGKYGGQPVRVAREEVAHLMTRRYHSVGHVRVRHPSGRLPVRATKSKSRSSTTSGS